MFSFDKKQVSISLKYLGGHPELPKQRTLTAFRNDNFIQFKEVIRPVLAVQSIKKIILSNFGPGTPMATSRTGFTPDNERRSKKVLVITVDYNGLDVHMLFTGDNMTAKYAQFMGLLKGNYKEYVHSETSSS
ncbi:MAG TPA: hypothetical protein DEF34_04030 [Desulfotomaculum sp.]|nr:MAG: hypothetical protein VR67_15990 [Peptococcaceae bacterium BRH_c8a]KJS76511.1 MAG: hypothetical protein JL56_05350 [Desulfotomaculum sp. BICA1-6]HBX22796.1 hypothetical protein [Desulfotomaculum sp.]